MLKKRTSKNSEREEFDNYWNYGLNGNKEEYEKYLIIKSRLEGKRFRAPRFLSRSHGVRTSLLSYYPLMRLALLLTLAIFITRAASVFAASGLGTRFYVAAGGWSAAALFIYWYFAKRWPMNGTLFLIDYFCPDIWFIRSLPYWLFWTGTILATLDLDEFKVWLAWAQSLSYRLGYPMSLPSSYYAYWPDVPALWRTAGKITASAMFLLFWVDMLLLRLSDGE